MGRSVRWADPAWWSRDWLWPGTVRLLDVLWASQLLESLETRTRIAGRASSKTTHDHGHSKLCWQGSVTRAGSGQHWLAAPGQEGPRHRWACPVHRQTRPCCPPCQQMAGKRIQNQSFPLRMRTCQSFNDRNGIRGNQGTTDHREKGISLLANSTQQPSHGPRALASSVPCPFHLLCARKHAHTLPLCACPLKMSCT